MKYNNIIIAVAKKTLRTISKEENSFENHILRSENFVGGSKMEFLVILVIILVIILIIVIKLLDPPRK